MRLITPIVFFAIDRFVKAIISGINIGGDFVKFGLYKNYAGAFSLPIGGWPYNAAGIVLLIIFAALFYKELKRAYSLRLTAYGLVILGGLSNLIDRIALGYAVDYFQIAQRSFFNIADAMIVMGITFLLTQSLKSRNGKMA